MPDAFEEVIGPLRDDLDREVDRGKMSPGLRELHRILLTVGITSLCIGGPVSLVLSYFHHMAEDYAGADRVGAIALWLLGIGFVSVAASVALRSRS